MEPKAHRVMLPRRVAGRAAASRIEPSRLRALSRVQPVRAALHIALEWTAILAAAWLCWSHWHPALYVLCVAFIGARQHALLVLMHDGSHHRLFPDRRVNDWIGEIFLAWPFVAFSMQSYRRSHFAHHRYVNSDRDPDWVRKQNPEWEFPKGRIALARVLLASLFGGGVLRQIRYAREIGGKRSVSEAPATGAGRALRTARVVFLVLLAAVILGGGLLVPFVLFWVVPFATWTQLVLHLRSIAEHFALERDPRDDLYGGTRNTFANAFDRVFIASKNVGLHLDHHLYPSVPFYRLPELHALLLQDAGYRASAHHTAGYWRVLCECIGASAARQIRTQTS
jgi:fatty acid desaturase